MTSRRWIAALCLALCALQGCAQLSVEVQVLDRARIPADKLLESNVWLEAQRHASQIETGYYERLEQTLIAELDNAVEVIVPKINMEPDDARKTLRKQARDYALPRLRDAKKKADEGLMLYESVRDQAGDNQKELSQALKSLQDGRNVIRMIGVDVETQVQKTIPVLGSDTAASLAEIEKKIKKALVGTRLLSQVRNPLFGGTTLFEDPLASWVVNSDDAAWRGKFNDTYGGGFLGNADIAVKMEADGVFTLKGVRLDASKTTEAAFAVIRQSLNIAAAGTGLPAIKRPTASTPATGTTPAAPDTPDVSSELLANADAAKQAEKHQREQAQYAMSAILDVIVRNAGRLDDGETERKDAIAQIKAVYGAYKPLMQSAAEETKP